MATKGMGVSYNESALCYLTGKPIF